MYNLYGMMYPFSPYFLNSPFFLLFVMLAVWSLIWKGLALWRAGRNNQMYWFIALLIINTAGILEIIYIAFFQKNMNPRMTSHPNAVPTKTSKSVRTRRKRR